MKSPAHLSRKRKNLFLGFLAVATYLSCLNTSQAGLTLTASSATSDYAIDSTGTYTEGSSFDGSGMLVYPGTKYAILTGDAGDGDSPTQYKSSLTTPFQTTASTNSNLPFGSYVPSNFGTAATDIYTASSGNRGGFTSQGGIYWTSSTNVNDGLDSTENADQASVSFSTASATFVNNTSSNILLLPGAILSVTGTLGSSPAYIAAGLSSSYTLTYGENVTTTQLDSIILAADTYIDPNNSSLDNDKIAYKGGSNSKETASVTVSGSTFSGAGTSLNATEVTVLPGESITINSALTLISDPGSTLVVSSSLPSGFPTDPSDFPDFGVAANSDPVATVPEPSTLAMFGSSLLIAGFWARSNRRKTLRVG